MREDRLTQKQREVYKAIVNAALGLYATTPDRTTDALKRKGLIYYGPADAAGITPMYPVKSKVCAARAALVVKSYSKIPGMSSEPGELVADLFSDLMHFCDANSLNLDELLDTASGNYENEKRAAA